MLYTEKRAGDTDISHRVRFLPSLVSRLETEMLSARVRRAFLCFRETPWAGLVLVGEYLEPSLEIARVRSAPELQVPLVLGTPEVKR